MPSSDREQTLALAGAMLALNEVRGIAGRGSGNNDHIGPCVQATLGEYRGDAAALYGGIGVLSHGLRQLADHLNQPRDHEATRYLVVVLQLERRLTKSPRVFTRLRMGLEKARSQLAYFDDPVHRNLISALGQLYSDTLSTLRPRIVVRGDRANLEDEHNAALIRTLLICAVRAAGLWRNAGGNRILLLARRQRVIETARWLLASRF